MEFSMRGVGHWQRLRVGDQERPGEHSWLETREMNARRILFININ